MKRTTLVMLLLTLCGFSSASSALSESEAEDLADLTAVFVYLKNDCGYNELPNNEINGQLSILLNKIAGICVTTIALI